MIAISFDIHPLGLLLVPSMFTFFLLLFYRSMLSPTIIREKERERERGGGGRERDGEGWKRGNTGGEGSKRSKEKK